MYYYFILLYIKGLFSLSMFIYYCIIFIGLAKYKFSLCIDQAAHPSITIFSKYKGLENE